MNLSKGVVVEFDSVVIDGAALLFETTRQFLADLDGLPFDRSIEDLTFVGRDYLSGMTRFFAQHKTKKTAPKAARLLQERFRKAVNAALPAALTVSFRNFVKAMTDAGVAVTLVSRADLDVPTVQAALAPLLNEKVRFFHDDSPVYGTHLWEVWRRALAASGISRTQACCIVGSGFATRSALAARMTVVAAINDFVAHQDFTGAATEIAGLTGTTAKKILKLLKV